MATPITFCNKKKACLASAASRPPGGPIITVRPAGVILAKFRAADDRRASLSWPVTSLCQTAISPGSAATCRHEARSGRGVSPATLLSHHLASLCRCIIVIILVVGRPPKTLRLCLSNSSRTRPIASHVSRKRPALHTKSSAAAYLFWTQR